jgi:prostaglandin-H2 D-isomerase / glutathione transferase
VPALLIDSTTSTALAIVFLVMPEIKLLYFAGKGRAEAIRLAFTIGDIPFENETFQFSEFGALKASGRLPFGQVPLLTVDGVDYTQSGAMLRFAGKLAGLYPRDDDVAALRIDQFVCAVEDVLLAIFKYRGPDKDALLATRTEFVENVGPKLLGGLEAMAKANKESDTWLAGPKLSIADLALYFVFGNISFGNVDHVQPSMLETYPVLMASYKGVASHPAVIAWNNDHPWKK